jgi:galactoside O-acetyltransferase
MAYLDKTRLKELGLAACGDDVRISERAVIYNPGSIRVGDNVRIDDFCIMTAGVGGITLGCHIHIAPFCLLVGAGAIAMKDFSGLSSRVSIYSSTDDYSGAALTNPTVAEEFKNVRTAPVAIGAHAIVGSGAVLLPGAELSTGVAVGALSLVSGHCRAFGIYAGTPARFVKERSRELLSLEQGFLDKFAG